VTARANSVTLKNALMSSVMAAGGSALRRLRS
jgi:hypothetical protein